MKSSLFTLVWQSWSLIEWQCEMMLQALLSYRSLTGGKNGTSAWITVIATLSVCVCVPYILVLMLPQDDYRFLSTLVGLTNVPMNLEAEWLIVLTSQTGHLGYYCLVVVCHLHTNPPSAMWLQEALMKRVLASTSQHHHNHVNYYYLTTMLTQFKLEWRNVNTTLQWRERESMC